MLEQKEFEFITKVYIQTTRGELEWISILPPGEKRDDTDPSAGKMYEITVHGRKLRLYKKGSHVSLLLLDQEGRCDYIFKHQKALNELHETVERRCTSRWVEEWMVEYLDSNLETLTAKQKKKNRIYFYILLTAIVSLIGIILYFVFKSSPL